MLIVSKAVPTIAEILKGCFMVGVLDCTVPAGQSDPVESPATQLLVDNHADLPF
jgi:hypothetical protein